MLQTNCAFLWINAGDYVRLDGDEVYCRVSKVRVVSVPEHADTLEFDDGLSALATDVAEVRLESELHAGMVPAPGACR